MSIISYLHTQIDYLMAFDIPRTEMAIFMTAPHVRSLAVEMGRDSPSLVSGVLRVEPPGTFAGVKIYYADVKTPMVTLVAKHFAKYN